MPGEVPAVRGGLPGSCPDPAGGGGAAPRRHAVRYGAAPLQSESDRGEAMAAELRRCGVRITVGENEITVEPGVHAPDEALCAHNDHRVAMSLAVLLCRTGGSIDGAECVAKKYAGIF